jgi:hypothetical protein
MIVLLAPAPVKSSSDRTPGENARMGEESVLLPGAARLSDETRVCELVWETNDESATVAVLPELADQQNRGYVLPEIPLLNLLGISVLVLVWPTRGPRRRPVPRRVES